MGANGEQNFIGEGISFCAVCDGAFYKGQEVAVIGGGNSALQEALLLSDLCKKVTVVQNLDFLTGEQALIDQLDVRENIEVITGTVVESFDGQDELSAITIKRLKDGKTSSLSVNGVFLAVGLEPQNQPFGTLAGLDERGYIISDERCKTKTDGIFTAGDCRTKKIRQVTTAAADGSIAALAACEYIDNL